MNYVSVLYSLKIEMQHTVFIRNISNSLRQQACNIANTKQTCPEYSDNKSWQRLSTTLAPNL